MTIGGCVDAIVESIGNGVFGVAVPVVATSVPVVVAPPAPTPTHLVAPRESASLSPSVDSLASLSDAAFAAASSLALIAFLSLPAWVIESSRFDLKSSKSALSAFGGVSLLNESSPVVMMSMASLT